MNRLKNSQIKKLDSLLEKKGYNERRRKIAISHIQGFFYTVKKSPKYVTKSDIEKYLANTSNTHLKFWLRFFYSDLIIHFKYFKLSKLEKQLKAMGFDDICFGHILNLNRYFQKPISRITKEDMDEYIQINNIKGDELLKLQSISNMFTTEEPKRKPIILSKNKKALSYDEVKEKLSHAPDIVGLIERARQLDKHYCIKLNSMVKVCRVDACGFYSYTCPAHVPICESHVPVNIIGVLNQL